ncbi:hypothetical protein QBC46DRAFT_387669 [Diplogelasinospora grovesii]|uniref:ATP-dependent RNA helicase DHX8 n=1 Tax=Diplogelasinospora grovesii TaxID=303347 RepID=A0AAN6S3V8_9PEZI|nr:hypothetical protein QBC46DRAFT_387669 [Diplogelasinospora grovesii]
MNTPYRQIRAHYDDQFITVYQAYSSTIASAAVQQQKLNASPDFRTGTRMTWIKPSWGWMLYRSGYSFKDAGQERVLALKMRHNDFVRGLLERGVLSHKQLSQPKTDAVRIQWDPERTVRLEKLEYRSIQIGIPSTLVTQWVEETIVSIEDVTDTARTLKKVLGERPDVTDEELRDMGLIPEERPFEVPDELQVALGMVTREEQRKG